MFTSEDYLYGWLLYLAGGLVFFGCWWYLTRKIALIEIRAVLRSICWVTMFVPWYASPEMDYLAPAVVIAGVEGIFDGNFWRAGAPLLTAITTAILFTLVYTTVRRIYARKNQDSTVEATRPSQVNKNRHST